MKNLRTPIALSLALVLSVACSSKSTEDQSQMDGAENHEMHEVASTDVAKATPVAFKDESTTKIFNAYLAMKDALVATDGDKVSAEAKKLEALLVDQKFNAIKADVQKIAASTDTKIQRDSFDSLSEQMITLAKNSELTSGNLFLQHCPMANGNTGANWLSLSEEIRNPYFGDKMLKCGSVTEKI
ncbi:uncharacterized protein DUF3347 [Algoriphagus ratkowskyi]|uniref:DUF3347 domain-containing protein n=1 Tax=Algoriphagus ratkowskyi TaxID=57028 RepID=A0A2W7R9Y9_9BACT|nr:DUF3347 domain-containing protein [Algoriphagus ratkowskyi]PZX52487.1 uncharacterized protein DUF3347 [Algoriphagus ratkowskyi]TXD76171.1 DUF3347 domain-containing protein [Algoriphagus ratkowskyi]